ncbi:hypothetical protein ORI89_10260 [Sphingobacterium sp. UT-1RO-CII-1]|uniref:DUF5018-related domain-containing protein n=1 Tax=Sphingobacterium sp. UT-1RO-CII-1 TaxID=2995225 RepID=UPI00227BC345|nr:hypothetical protein [Sphingobacterium sp. UT-1RO-CII-1]MCY4780034.1 hypothetical protein [Sphingobacterium sp. UT-1RO-CII-1]
MTKIFKNIKLLGVLFLSVLASSCLKKDLPEYPLFDGNSISVVNAEHRFKSRIKTMHGEPIITMKGLTVNSKIDEASGTIDVTVIIPEAETGSGADFTAEEKTLVKQNSIWFYYTISTAATMTPLDGTAKPGDPADATKPLKYRVTAANGQSKDWTVNVVSFKNE